MTMIKLNINEAKTHLSAYLERVAAGETIVICKRNKPIAEIRPLPVAPVKKRPLGLAKGKVEIHPAFFEPLPEDLLDLFEAKGR